MNRYLAVGVLLLILLTACARETAPPPRYMIGGEETVDQATADARPPLERWQALKQLTETASINVVCYPDGTTLQETQVISDVVRLMQASRYVKAGEFPRKGPDLKVYFQRADGSFIMAARVYPGEAVLASPEGPVIQTDPRLVEHFLADGACRPD